MSPLILKVAGFSMARTAIAGFVLSLFYFFLIYDSGSALVEQMNAVKLQIEEELRKKIETERVLKKEEDMRSDVALRAKTYEAVKAKIPLEFDPSALRILVERFSESTNLEIKSQRTTNSPQQNSSINLNSDLDLVDEVAIDYKFEGNFNQILNFINQISNFEKVIKVSNLKISTTVGTTGPSKSLDFEATIIGYKQSLSSQSKKQQELK